jgi:hypothetical protein
MFIVEHNHPTQIAERQELTEILYKEMGGSSAQAQPEIEDQPERETDESIIARAGAARNGDKFQTLFDGNWNGLYPSQSEADFALVDIITFYTQNRKQIARIFRKSQLGQRDKAKRDNYVGPMVEKSLDSQVKPAKGQAEFVKKFQDKFSSGTESGGGSGSTVGGDHAAPDEWPVLDPIAMYGLGGDIVRAIEPHTESDPVAILVQSLLAFGMHIGRGSHVPVEGDEHHGNIFLLLVGITSKGRKGTSWGRVRQLFEQMLGWIVPASGLSSGEGLKWSVRDPVEGKSAKDSGDPGVSDKRLLVVESEFAQALRATARTGNTLSSTVREAWDTGNLRTLTKNDPIVATGAHVAIIGHITVTELRAELTETDRGNGFANRFLFVCVRRSKILPFGGGKIEESVLRGLVARLTQAADAARQHGRAVMMTEAARTEWKRVYPALSEGLDGLLGAVTGRAEAQCLRLALIYALLDKATEIDLSHLLAAIALWKYCEQSARFIFGSALGTRIADEILRALRSTGPGGLTRTDISKLFKGHESTDKISVALNLLLGRNLAHPETLHTTGRSVEIWRAGPAKEAK